MKSYDSGSHSNSADDPRDTMQPEPFDSNEPDFATWRPRQRNSFSTTSGTSNSCASIPRAVYIHIPFCRHRCGYCNFSLVSGRDYLIDRFLDALKTEIEWLDCRYPLKSLFLGGGTPTHLSPLQLATLQQIIISRFDYDSATEVTAEANPNDLNQEKCRALEALGVNRVSIGVQSLTDSKLRLLERDHHRDEVQQAVRNCRDFARSISFDLIFAAPDESLKDWESDLDQALELNPDHLSTYELTFEKGTQFWNRLQLKKMVEADEDLRAEMYEMAIHKLRLYGFEHYEISSFAKPGHRCRHNECYWTGLPYLAFGPGASRYVDGIRQTNSQSPMTYLKRVESGRLPLGLSEKLAPEDSARELLAVGLRRVEGIDEREFIKLTGFSIGALLGARSEIWISQSLMTHEGDRWKLTDRGRLGADWLATQILQ